MGDSVFLRVVVLALVAGSSGGQERVAGASAGVEEYWGAVLEARELRPRFEVERFVDERDRELAGRLEETLIPSLRVEGAESLAGIGELLRRTSGIPIVVDPGAEQAVVEEGVVFEIDLRAAIAVDDVLDIVVELAGPEVSWTVRDGLVRITTLERAGAERVVFVHSLVDLLIDPRAFVGGGAELGGLFAPLEQDELATIVLENVRPESWELSGVSLSVSGGLLTVVHDPAVHAEIEAFLDHLRAFFVPDPAVSEPGTAIGPWPAADARDEEVLAALEEVRLSVDFGTDRGGAPLAEVADFLSHVTGVGFLLSGGIFDELGPEETAVTLHLPERCVREVLDVLCDVNRELAWRVEDGVVKFLLREEALGGQVLVLTDVRHLTRSFAGGGDGGAQLTFGDELPSDVPVVLSADELAELIRSTVAPRSWDEDARNALRIGEQGVLFVNQRPEVHAAIRRLLDHLDEVASFRARIEGGLRARER
jgi:hypothetical protein